MESDHYLRRLQLAGEPGLNAVGLRKLQERHLLTVPFENLDIVVGKSLSLELEDILAKIVDRRRGGLCYELNAAFCWLLRSLGFEVKILSARVANSAGEWSIPFDHMCLEVRLEKSWLVDVGFGDGFVHPLDLDDGNEIKQRGGIFQLVDDADAKILQRYDRSAMKFMPLYRFGRESCRLEDFREACRHHETAEDSKFRKSSLVMMAAPDGRIMLSDEMLVLIRNARRDEYPIANQDAFKYELKRLFGVSLVSVEDE